VSTYVTVVDSLQAGLHGISFIFCPDDRPTIVDCLQRIQGENLAIWLLSGPSLKRFAHSDEVSFSEDFSVYAHYELGNDVESQYETIIHKYRVRFEVFTGATMKNGVLWGVTPCGSCKNGRFGGTCAYFIRVTRIGEL
jgi:hypothetical protein